MVLRKVLTTAVVAAALLGVGAVARTGAQPGLSQSTLPTLTNCLVVWKDAREVASRIPGIIEEIYVQEGDVVLPGQQLARLDSRETEIEYEIQQMLGNSSLSIHASSARLAEFRSRLEAAKKLARKNAISLEELRLADVQVTINEVEQSIEIEKQKMEKLKARRLKILLDDHTIRSPMKGIIQKIYKREREALQAVEGLQMFRIVNTDQVWVEGHVSVSYLYDVKKGQSVTVTLADADGNPMSIPRASGNFRGKIVYVDPDVAGASRKFMVRAEVDNRNLILHAGLPARMEIDLKSTPAVTYRRTFGDR